MKETKPYDLFNQPLPTAPYYVVEKRQYINGKWDEHYCLRYYFNPDMHPNYSDCKQEFKDFNKAKEHARKYKLEFRLKPYIP
jgi:hypothetical protein